MFKIIALLFLLVFFNHSFFAQKNDSTTTRNNKQIEELKKRINKIDGESVYLEEYIKENEELKKELKIKNDSIEKLNTIISQLKSGNLTARVLNNNAVGANFLLGDCNCFRLFYEPEQTKINFKLFHEIDSIATICKLNPKNKIKLVGHADKTGNDKHNEFLSKDRVLTLRWYLTNTLHVAKEKVLLEWHGSTIPFDKNKEALNRRVEVFLE